MGAPAIRKPAIQTMDIDDMQILSVQEGLPVDSRAVRAQPWRRDGRRWIVEDFTEDATLPLASVGAELPLTALYDGIAL
ncbi:hypothetical protein D3869_02890 [Azospirillum brasilense]|uniref:Uncharacterized protein n=1 Tax=Azospirillum brasilense TaxID=192 RepID=A0A4D8QYQ7_AZOBR|nr:hypothetical protein [Azospirillum brasilense]QCO14260.1 hypothetical protein D3869_02890 [Azospirillum brasilense]